MRLAHRGRRPGRDGGRAGSSAKRQVSHPDRRQRGTGWADLAGWPNCQASGAVASDARVVVQTHQCEGLVRNPCRRFGRSRQRVAGERGSSLDTSLRTAGPVHRRARTSAAVPWLDAARRDGRWRTSGTHQGGLVGCRPTHRRGGQRAVAVGGRSHGRSRGRTCATSGRAGRLVVIGHLHRRIATLAEQSRAGDRAFKCQVPGGQLCAGSRGRHPSAVGSSARRSARTRDRVRSTGLRLRADSEHPARPVVGLRIEPAQWPGRRRIAGDEYQWCLCGG